MNASLSSSRRSETRKVVIALLVLVVSLGALGWQMLAHRQRMADAEAAFREEQAPIQWRKATEAERKAVLASITNQLEAFKRDDYKAATQYQSEGLRRNFATAADFRTMMQRAYPQFAHYKSVQFGAMQADTRGKLATVPVKLTGRDGVQVAAVYQMVLEDGVWRVSGVSGGTNPAPAPKKAPVTPVSA